MKYLNDKQVIFEINKNEGHEKQPDSLQLLPLSSVQQAIWLDQQLNSDSINYNIGYVATIEGDVDPIAMSQAFNTIVARHDVFHLRLDNNGNPLQYFSDNCLPTLEFQDVSQICSYNDFDLEKNIDDRFNTPFALCKILWRAALIKKSNKLFYLQFCCHHIVSDGLSLSLLNEEIAEVYNQLVKDGEYLSKPSLSYKDFIADDIAYRKSNRFFKDEIFWLKRFEKLPPPLFSKLKNNKPHHALSSKPLIWSITNEKFDKIKKIANKYELSVLHFMYAIFSCYFIRVKYVDEVSIGIPLHNRRTALQKQTMGMFASVIPVKIKISSCDSFTDIMRKASVELRKCYKHQRMPIIEIQRKINNKNKSQHSHLFDMSLSYESYDVNVHLAKAVIQSIRPHHRAQYPLAVTINEYTFKNRDCDNPITIDFDFSSAYMTLDEVIAMKSRLSILLDGVLENENTPIFQLPLLSQEDNQFLLKKCNADTEKMTCSGLIHKIFEEQVKKTPLAIAAVLGEEKVSYTKLNQLANNLAHHLIGSGIQPNDRVAICLDRNLDMLVGILGILKAGGAYVPLDPAYPSDRLEYILEDAFPKILVTHNDLVDKFNSAVPKFFIDSSSAQSVNADYQENPIVSSLELNSRSLAYVIYTSGSTGQPKGVMVEHWSVVRLLLTTNSHFKFSRNDVWTLCHSFSFDFSVWELFGAICHGGKLVIVSSQCARSPQTLFELICREKVTILNQTPSAFRQLIAVQGNSNHSLRCVIFGGEALEMHTLIPWVNKKANISTRLINMYGITEITVHATFYEIKQADIGTHTGSIIGSPLNDLSIYILDDHGQVVPVGVPGELYIAGDGVARGYLNLPEMTASRFLDDPFSPLAAQRMYRTGDLGRWLPDGNIEYLGRNDFQVKIRGFRIEPGEIEACLTACDDVREAVVVAREDVPGDRRLVAYLIPEDGCVPEPAALRLQLSRSLAEYMLPAAFVVVSTFPLTPNGKLDRRALPAPDRSAVASRGYAAPLGDTETALAAVWCELLGVTQVGRHDNFFELGGHSLMMVSLLDRLRILGWSLDIRSAYSATTLADMALCVTLQHSGAAEVPPHMIPEGSAAISPDMLPLITLSQHEIDTVVATVCGGAANVQDIYPLSPLQEGILFHHLLQEQGDTYLLHSLMAFDSRGHLEAFIQALQFVIDRHDILRTSVCSQGVSRPVQVVWRRAVLQVNSFESGNADDRLSSLREHINPRQRRISLEKAPLFSADCVYDPGRQQWLLGLCFHHMVCDHITMALICDEITRVLQGNGSALPAPRPYRDFIAQLICTPEAAHEEYFRSRLAGIDTPTAPFGILDVQESGGRTAEASLTLDALLAGRIQVGARGLGVTPGILFHAACARMLAQLCGRDDVVFGTVLMGRLQAGRSAEGGLGMFINTLPLCLSLAGYTAREAILATARELATLLEHEQAPLALALRCSGVAAPLPLFSTLLNYRHSLPGGGADSWQGMHLLEAEERTNYPLTLSVDDTGDSFILTAQTVTGISPGRILSYMRTAMEGLVNALGREPESPFSRVAILPPDERRLLLETFNAPRQDYPHDSLVHVLFEEQALRTPQALAVVSEEASLTYDSLNRQANRLAHRLLALGIGPDDRVAVFMDRGHDTVVALLGVLKAGGAYVPLDPAAPRARLQYMLGDAAPVAIVTRRELLQELNSPLPVVLTDAPQPGAGGAEKESNPGTPGLTSRNLAYVIYTSGSTGQPKGVMVEHRSINRLVINNAIAHINSQDCVAHCANVAFDASTWEIWSALLNGAKLLVVSSAALLDPVRFSDTLLAGEVSALWLTSGLFNQYIDGLKPVFRQLRYLLVGGEALDPRKISQLQQSASQPAQLINGYGPTETTTFAASYLIDSPVSPSRSIPIGKPISNTRIYILDDHGQVVPVGVPGELHIAGDGVARGYLNLPEMTASRFLDDPFSPLAAQRMYRTGDLGRWLPDGNIEYLGRNDFQVKIRGFRIEPGEIEACLTACDDVREAVVVAREDVPGDRRLVAYLIPEDGCVPEPAALRLQLSRSLAEYMLPAAFVVVSTFPLTPNGKLDRRALPAPDRSAVASRGYAAPLGDTETALAAVWCELFGVTQVGRHDNFFELGGHSLMAVQLMNRIKASFLIDVPISTFFMSPTIFELSEAILSAQVKMAQDTEIEEIEKMIDLMSPEELELILKEGSDL